MQWNGECSIYNTLSENQGAIYPIYFKSSDLVELKKLILDDPPFKIRKIYSEPGLLVKGDGLHFLGGIESVSLFRNEANEQKSHIEKGNKDWGWKIRLAENLDQNTNLDYEKLYIIEPYFSSHSKNRVKELRDYLLDKMLKVSISSRNIQRLKTPNINVHGELYIFHKDEQDPFCIRNLYLEDVA